MAHGVGDSAKSENHKQSFIKAKSHKENQKPKQETNRSNEHTLLKQARTLGTPSLGPSMPGMKSILGPIQLKGLTIVKSSPFSAPSAVKHKKKEQRLRTTAISKY